MDHTSGAQRLAEGEATAEQRAQWGRRLAERAEELSQEARDLAEAASAHGTIEASEIAQRARAASDGLRGRSTVLELGRHVLAVLRGDGSGVGLGYLRRAVWEALDADPATVYATRDRDRLIVGVMDSAQWFAGPPWTARPYDEAESGDEGEPRSRGPRLITPDRGDSPPFAAELVVDRPPHER